MEHTLGVGKEPLEEMVVVVSDLHLGDGPRFANNGKNILEEFYRDREFVKFLNLVCEHYKDVPRLRLKLNGDIFDSQSVLFLGRNYDMPFEVVGKYKMKRIIRAHPAFFNALAKFLALPGRTIDYHIGNHDFFVEWSSVQRLIVRRIAGNSQELADKIRFLDKEDYRGVHYFHGHIEPHSATNYSAKYITHRFGVELPRPLLNYPYGTFLTVEFANRLKFLNPLVGRLRTNDYIWRYCLLRNWSLGLYALALYFWVLIYNRFFSPLWDLRRKANLTTTFKIMLWSILGHDLTEYARKVFERNPEIKVAICGHDHEAMRVTISRGHDSGTYINTGTWTTCYDIKEEPIVCTWKRWRALEKLVKRSAKFFRIPQLMPIERLTFALVEYYANGNMNARLLEYRPNARLGTQIREVL